MKTTTLPLIREVTGRFRPSSRGPVVPASYQGTNSQPGARLNRYRGWQDRECQAFTRIELIVAIIASCILLAALFLPAFPAGRARSRSAACLNNLRQIDLGLKQYALEYEQFINASEWGAVALDSAGARFQPYLPDDPQALICPDKLHSTPSAARPEALVAFELLSYGYNGAGTAPDGRELELGMGLWRHISTPRVKVPSQMIVLGDSGVGIQSSAVLSPNEIASLNESALPVQPQLPSSRHSGGANILFCDGHAAFGKQTKWIERTPEARRQWNNDNQPHRETW